MSKGDGALSDRATLRFVEDHICALQTVPDAWGSPKAVDHQVLLPAEAGRNANEAPDKGWKDSRIATPRILREKLGAAHVVGPSAGPPVRPIRTPSSGRLLLGPDRAAFSSAVVPPDYTPDGCHEDGPDLSLGFFHSPHDFADAGAPIMPFRKFDWLRAKIEAEDPTIDRREPERAGDEDLPQLHTT
jgi:hypothetical protein